MQLMHEQLNITGNNTIKVKWDDFPHFTYPWHHHKELEIVCILKSYGKRFVGDSIQDFSEGDIVLLGSNLPHFWKNAPEFYAKDSDLTVNAVVVQFSPDIFAKTTLDLPEFSSIRKLFEHASRGVRFSDTKNKVLSKRISKLRQLNGMERYIELLHILNLMAESRKSELLASSHFEQNTTGYSDNRINKILTFINFNYTQKINIATLANLSGMNITALCRFFKSKTGKTIVQHINELRIGFACKLMIEKQLPISMLSLECGFNNQSNFNKTFKEITTKTPTEYNDALSKNQG